MYEELYSAWKTELENRELQKLPLDFYSRLALYFKRLKEETRMLERRSAKALLLSEERRRAEIMVSELAKTRLRKISVEVMMHREITTDCLTDQEKEISSGLSSTTGRCFDFVKNIFQGNAEINVRKKDARMVTLRFLKEVPEIIGTDMHRYGPYQVEDICSLPARNASVLIDKKLAARIEVR